jgi:peptide subunit release factor 1 (eRF1)
MTDYSELVKALRRKGLSNECDSCGYGYRFCPDSECNDACHVERIIDDAADAIEALQAEQKKTVTQIFGEEQQEWEEYCAGLMSRIRELKAQMPKRGEWKPFDLTYGRSIYSCSVCEQATEVPMCMEKPMYAYCPNCGAKMTEVRE